MVGTVFSEMAGPNYVKFSGIDEGHSEHVFGQKKNYVIIVIKDFRNNPNTVLAKVATPHALSCDCFVFRRRTWLVAAAKQVSTSHRGGTILIPKNHNYASDWCTTSARNHLFLRLISAHATWSRLADRRLAAFT